MTETDVIGKTIQNYSIADNDTGLAGNFSDVTWSQGSPFGARINYNNIMVEIYALQAIDYEKSPIVNFNITLTDGAPPPFERSSNYTITVIVENVDDECPHLNRTKTSQYTIYENDVTALAFLIEDVDTPPTELLLVNLTSTNSTHNLMVNKTGLFPGNILHVQ